tara:strand:+ start:854 stop:1060 length:207 start_codon:yes stop_codon:yes gene_type:complete
MINRLIDSCCLLPAALFFMPRSLDPSTKIEMTMAQEYTHGFIKLVDIKTIHAHGIKLKIFIKILVSDI